MNCSIVIDSKSVCAFGVIILSGFVIYKLSPEMIENVLIHGIDSLSNIECN